MISTYNRDKKSNNLPFFSKLLESMHRNYVVVDSKKNPLFHILSNSDGKPEVGRFILEQYFFFSKNIGLWFLDGARNIIYAGYPRVAEEFFINVKEELGVYEDSKSLDGFHEPHTVSIRRGFWEMFGHDIFEASPEDYTEYFCQKSHSLFMRHAFFTMGAAYAYEATARKELQCIWDGLKRNWMHINISNHFTNFFEGHIGEFEINHENRLRERCLEALYTDSDAADKFQSGFHVGCKTLDNWWRNMALHISSYFRL